jgi:imidazolonepropionase-like amidohydrolase
MSYTLLHNGTLIDGNGGAALKDAAVLIEDNRIREVGSEASITLPDQAVTRIDARGGFILPGMIDAHVHMMFEGIDLEGIMTTPFSYQFYEAIDGFRRTIEAGVTTVRDAGGADLGVKQAIERNLIAGPRMQISICMLSITGGHGDGWLPSGADMMWFASYPGRPGIICDGVEGVRQKVREVLRAGADVIKICATGGVSSPNDHPFDVQFSPAELEAFVQEAEFRRGTKVMAHAQGAQGINSALRAGVHSIEHGTLIDEEGIELMLERGAYLVPTLLVGAYSRENPSPSRPKWIERKGPELLAARKDNIQKAHEAGVKIAMGTDCGVCPHGLNLRELALMCEIGMSPMESIMAATKVAAECLGWDDQIGTIDAGKLADIIVCKTDPLADISSLAVPENISLVIKDGQIMKQLTV